MCLFIISVNYLTAYNLPEYCFSSTRVHHTQAPAKLPRLRSGHFLRQNVTDNLYTSYRVSRYCTPLFACCFTTQRVSHENIPAISPPSHRHRHNNKQASKQTTQDEVMAEGESAAAVGSNSQTVGEDGNRIFTGHSFYVSRTVPSRDRFCKIIEVRGVGSSIWCMWVLTAGGGLI